MLEHIKKFRITLNGDVYELFINGGQYAGYKTEQAAKAAARRNCTAIRRLEWKRIDASTIEATENWHYVL